MPDKKPLGDPRHGTDWRVRIHFWNAFLGPQVPNANESDRSLIDLNLKDRLKLQVLQPPTILVVGWGVWKKADCDARLFLRPIETH